MLALHSPAGGGCTCGRSDCSSPAKHPRTVHGLTDATTDPETIRGWWDRWPDANIGVRTGDAMDVLDLDGPDALDALDALALAEFGLPDDTATDIGAVIGPMVCTGRGIHIYVDPTGSGNRAGLADHVDWRGRGGYVVAPPSIHATGAVYDWGTTYGIDTPLRPAPDWLAVLVAGRHPTAGCRPVGARWHHLRDTRPGGRTRPPGDRRRRDTEHTLHLDACRLGQLVAGGELAALHAVGELPLPPAPDPWTP